MAGIIAGHPRVDGGARIETGGSSLIGAHGAEVAPSSLVRPGSSRPRRRDG
jgi:hypothetical protein